MADVVLSAMDSEIKHQSLVKDEKTHSNCTLHAIRASDTGCLVGAGLNAGGHESKTRL